MEHSLDSIPDGGRQEPQTGQGVAKWLPDGDLEACFPD